MEIKYTNEAVKDIEGIYEYLIAFNEPQIVKARLADVRVEIERLCDTPDIGAHLSARINCKRPYRYIVCGKYIAFYLLRDDYVEIVRIFDGRQEWYKHLSIL